MLIGLVGFISSGKGTVGEILVKNHDFSEDSFAKALKDAAAVIIDHYNYQWLRNCFNDCQ